LDEADGVDAMDNSKDSFFRSLLTARRLLPTACSPPHHPSGMGAGAACGMGAGATACGANSGATTAAGAAAGADSGDDVGTGDVGVVPIT
jgi:hypothetical protein